jgi:hypothetical protein
MHQKDVAPKHWSRVYMLQIFIHTVNTIFKNLLTMKLAFAFGIMQYTMKMQQNQCFFFIVSGMCIICHWIFVKQPKKITKDKPSK